MLLQLFGPAKLKSSLFLGSGAHRAPHAAFTNTHNSFILAGFVAGTEHHLRVKARFRRSDWGYVLGHGHGSYAPEQTFNDAGQKSAWGK